MLLILLYACQKSPEPDEYMQELPLVGKTYKGLIGNMCNETSPPDPCAGTNYYLIMKFNDKNVEMTDLEEGLCGGEINRKKYVGSYHLTDSILTLTTKNNDKEQGSVLQLILRKNKLVEKKNDVMGIESENIFNEVKFKK